MWTIPRHIMVFGAVLLASCVDGIPYQRKSFTKSTRDISDEAAICGTRPLENELSYGESRRYIFKILGGNDAKHGSNPWQVNMIVKARKGNVVVKKHFCGGTILSEYWVLTAAHCYINFYIVNVKDQTMGIKLNVSNYYIVVGDNDQRRIDEDEQWFQADQFILHEGFILSEDNDDDIALIKIKPYKGHGIQFGDYVQPACLPDADTELEPDHKMIISGWGHTDETGRVPNILQENKIKLSEDKRACSHTSYNPDLILCSPAGRRNTCMGDSGGPLVANINGVYQVLGVTAFGDKIACEPPYASYFTKVQAYLDWISSTISDNSESEEEEFLPPRRLTYHVAPDHTIVFKDTVVKQTLSSFSSNL